MRKHDVWQAAMLIFAIPGAIAFCLFMAAYVKLMLVILSAIVGAI